MKRRIPVWIWTIVGTFYACLFTCAFAGGFLLTPVLNVVMNEAVAPLPPFGAAWTIIEQEFYGDLPEADSRMRAAVRGVLDELNDPYTVLIDPQPAKQEQRRLAGRYGDVGITLWWAEDGYVGISPYPDGPAAQSGIRKGDYLITIDGEEIVTTQTLTLGSFYERLQGEVSTTVTLGVLRCCPSQHLTMTITRAQVLHPSVQWRTIDARVGYLKITMFTGQTAVEVEKTLRELDSVTGLVLDLRGNYGGVVAPLPAVGGAFLPDDSLLYYVVERNHEEQMNVKKGDVLYTGPLVVLVDSGTASAAEILAGALQDHERAILIGSQTYGKGSIQNIHALPDGSSLHVTSAQWLTPARKPLDGMGLQPDIDVAQDAPGQDAGLNRAIAYLEEHIK